MNDDIVKLKAAVFDVLYVIDQHRNAIQTLEQRKGQLMAELAKTQQRAAQDAQPPVQPPITGVKVDANDKGDAK